ncbi:MAG: NADH-quinone oxidoreductase subunit L [Bacteroidia bacterium]
MEKFAWLIPALPLAGFIISIFAGKKLPEKVLASIASVAILIPFIITLGIFIPFASATEPEAIRILLMEWMSIGKFSVNFSFQLDQLSLMMMLVITGVGFLIHVYSAGYMHGDEGFNRFFAYLNLFVFFMLMLVMGSNYLMLFIGWEGVGLCSFLLIGFWHTNPEYAKAANKAFIMNRIGDLGLLLGIFLLFMRFSTLEYNRIMFEAESISMGDPIVVSATLLLFIGAIGKSAQIPLFTWLPDAMAGPTPVSALIHAATMVTAGVYLIIRSNVLFTLAPFTQEIIMIVGLATAIFAATIGLKQNDIKKVLAYSTVSQLGYMFFALGLGAYTAAYFHLFTHAFFKALLFLGSGSVIHAMSGEQDMRKMGGLKSALPVTHLTFLIGTIAIAGLPPLAGFFSKDEILAAAWHHNPVLWILGVGGALLTAFYMFRLYFLTFHGQFRGSEEQKHHLHESPASITVPLVILAVFSAIAGFINVPEVLGGGHWLENFFEPLLAGSVAVQELMPYDAVSHAMEIILMAVSVGLVLIVIFYAWFRYQRNGHLPSAEGEELPAAERILARKYYIDELYDALISNPVIKGASGIYRFIEVNFIDRIVNGVGQIVVLGSRTARFLQTGNVGFYIFAMVLGIILILAVNRFVV